MRFCLSNVISYGQTFLDIVGHTAAYIKKNLRRCYTPPSQKHASFARTILDMALKKRRKGVDGKLNKTLDRQIERFLAIFNGNWSDHTPEGLVHHCSVICSCGCSNVDQLIEAATSSFAEIVLASRPPIPALSRWLKCSDTAKWFVLAFSCHGIFQAGFKSIFTKSKSQDIEANLASLALVPLATAVVDESPFLCPDVPVARVQGCRAAKSEAWLDRPETTTELLTAIIATEPMYDLSCHFMEGQKRQLWLSADVCKRPLVNLVTPCRSPVVKQLSASLNMLTDPFGQEGPLLLLDGRLSRIAGV